MTARSNEQSFLIAFEIALQCLLQSLGADAKLRKTWLK
ncbi:MAG: hypothetical protein ACI8XC_002125 [Gammaproteobacteria bacterium]|jgi:hypothetical protein